jgi:hypothetical protein
MLGEVLVGEGLLTESQLAAALEQQRATGQPLGAILVSSGMLSGPTIAMALADQSGGPLQTEHGWATGWSRPQPRTMLTSDTHVEPLETEPEPVEEPVQNEAVAELARELERVKAELAALCGAEDAEEADHEDFVIVAAVGGRYVLHLGRGTPPPVGTQLQLPESPGASYVVSRHRPRRFLYLEQA